LNLSRYSEADRPTEKLDRIVQLAFSEGERISHAYLGTEHLLLAILRDEEESHEGDRYGISLERARAQVQLEFSGP
jgi:ATP-dependent Clp protease ATP-binding subunit ClpA